MYWDYGDPSRGASFEENSFHAGFRAHPNVEVTHFDYVELERTLGRDEMNRRLLAAVNEGDFDCLFCVMFTDQLLPEVLDKIRTRKRPITIAWGCDDHWRFDDYSRHWAPHFNWWVTTARSAVPRFKSIGYHKVIKSQWAVEPTVYHPVGMSKDFAVSFVGQPHGVRPQVMQFLHANGVPLAVFGFGWAGLQSRITHEQMVEVFSRSHISLNLSNSSVMGESQIKGRVFEVPACRSLLLTDDADDLAAYYEPGEEIVVYDGPEDMLAKIAHYLTQTDECERIAAAGYERTLREHTWKQRFDAIFQRVGLA